MVCHKQPTHRQSISQSIAHGPPPGSILDWLQVAYRRREAAMDNREVWVDHAKALGIVLVVYGHVMRGLHSAGIAMPETLFRLADSIVYSFHMPLFFFLAGLFFYQSIAAKDARGLLYSKLDTIVYPYVLWSLLQGLIEATLADYTNGAVTYGEVFALLWAPRAQFWFLYALLLCFLLRSEEHTSELQSRENLVCRLLL